MIETPHSKPRSKYARAVCTVVVQDQFEGAAARGQECNGGEFMSECELTNCVWGKRACQGAGREFLHLSLIGPVPMGRARSFHWRRQWASFTGASIQAICSGPCSHHRSMPTTSLELRPPVHVRPLLLCTAARSARDLAFFRAAMSIAKRIWPAILIDSKFSTKLHGTGLSPIFSD